MTTATSTDTLRLAAQLKLSPHDLLDIFAHISALDNLTEHADQTNHGDTESNLRPPILRTAPAPSAVLAGTTPANDTLGLTNTVPGSAGRQQCASAARATIDHRPTHLASPLASGRPP